MDFSAGSRGIRGGLPAMEAMAHCLCITSQGSYAAGKVLKGLIRPYSPEFFV